MFAVLKTSTKPIPALREGVSKVVLDKVLPLSEKAQSVCLAVFTPPVVGNWNSAGAAPNLSVSARLDKKLLPSTNEVHCRDVRGFPQD